MPAGWVGAIAGWCEGMAAAGRSRQTVGLRRAHIAQLARAVGGSPASVEAAEVVGWLARQSWARETRRAWRGSLRGFFEHVGRLDVVRAVPRVSAAEPVPRPAPDDVLAAGRRAADDRTTVILRLAAEAGLRRAEIAQVHARDMARDLAGWSVLVHGKGGRGRWVPLGDDLGSIVRLRCGGGWLLPGRIDGHLSPARVGELATAVLPAGWTLHTLRHRFATRAHAASGDLIAVSRLLGHASVATTQRYVATDTARLRQVAAAAA